MKYGNKNVSLAHKSKLSRKGKQSSLQRISAAEEPCAESGGALLAPKQQALETHPCVGFSRLAWNLHSSSIAENSKNHVRVGALPLTLFHDSVFLLHSVGWLSSLSSHLNLKGLKALLMLHHQ